MSSIASAGPLIKTRPCSQNLTPQAISLIDAAFDGVDPSKLFNYHTHIVGIGAGDTGAWVNPDMNSWLSPGEHLRCLVYLSASGVDDLSMADEQYVQRLNALIDNASDPHGRYGIMAFDYRHNKDGDADLEHSNFYTPNDYVFSLSQQYPDRFVPIISVHPYRADVLEALERLAKLGAKLIRWLPNAHGIDPADTDINPFYRIMKKYNMTHISHTGEEQAVQADDDQELGNPLRLRLPLDLGVKVIAAHCASLGDNSDLDNPGSGPLSSFDLWLRLMDEPAYDGLLFGEISAFTQFNRLGQPLDVLLNRTDLHNRLVNGSDYPLPAVNILFHLDDLSSLGYITVAEQESLAQIYDHNPLLFDFALKRTLKHPQTGQRFPAKIFLQHPDLPLAL